VTPRG
jgi:ATP-dependent RNA helicase DDX24/MAK5